jgi:hypothetical protein
LRGWCNHRCSRTDRLSRYLTPGARPQVAKGATAVQGPVRRSRCRIERHRRPLSPGTLGGLTTRCRDTWGRPRAPIGCGSVGEDRLARRGPASSPLAACAPAPPTLVRTSAELGATSTRAPTAKGLRARDSRLPRQTALKDSYIEHISDSKFLVKSKIHLLKRGKKVLCVVAGAFFSRFSAAAWRHTHSWIGLQLKF